MKTKPNTQKKSMEIIKTGNWTRTSNKVITKPKNNAKNVISLSYYTQ